jgi:prevent-host-death family protein
MTHPMAASEHNVHQAKTQLSKLLDAAKRGEEVVITRRGHGVNRFRLVQRVAG